MYKGFTGEELFVKDIRGHCLKLEKLRCTKDIRKCFFSHRRGRMLECFRPTHGGCT